MLAIAPTLDAVTLASSTTLTAVVMSGTTRRTVTASWSSDAPDIASIQAEGRVYGGRLGATTIRARYETLEATLPLRVVPDYSGAWSGWYRVARCQKLGGAGPNVCEAETGSRFGLRSTLTQQGASLAGTVDLLDNTGFGVVERGSVLGEIDQANALGLSGTTDTVDPREPRQSTLSDWNTALASDGLTMTGVFIRTRTFQNYFGPQQIKYFCELLDFKRPKP